ncbi:hypothetical protein OG21DRAFT_917251 [Imleria badia]|nr:hypothetical protein OG21DRAFT_917251 [Imleria badia]
MSLSQSAGEDDENFKNAKPSGDDRDNCGTRTMKARSGSDCYSNSNKDFFFVWIRRRDKTVESFKFLRESLPLYTWTCLTLSEDLSELIGDSIGQLVRLDPRSKQGQRLGTCHLDTIPPTAVPGQCAVHKPFLTFEAWTHPKCGSIFPSLPTCPSA